MLAALLAFCWHGARAADENQVKAAVVYNLLLFIEWPEPALPARSFHLCVFDNGALTAALRSHERKRVQGRALEIHRLATPREEVDACAAVLVAAGNPALLTRLGMLAGNRALLVIAEGAGAVDRGAMIGLHADGGRLGFDINYRAMKQSGLTPSSKILRLARTRVE